MSALTEILTAGLEAGTRTVPEKNEPVKMNDAVSVEAGSHDCDRAFDRRLVLAVPKFMC